MILASCSWLPTATSGPTPISSSATSRCRPAARSVWTPRPTGSGWTSPFRRQGGWRLRAVGQGYADGLAGLARDHGVTID
ncbi:hypothetical protein E1298_04430 [Actinomadura rubrisoli]|uniref:TerD domain-containing protein n=1 Tax=Actinomadura rubrisoli TaxID=2530368 RepID=A0A4R5C7B5_9ACTN|nr:hypothetical protein E1298_04430 [Actinomadura rubrisoli]